MYRIDVRGLSVVAGGTKILKRVNLSLKSGELVALLGPSGSGKSTLLKAVIGFRRGDGTVHVSGRDLYQEFDQLKQLIGYVPQDDVLHRTLTVIKSLRYAARLRLPQASGKEIDQTLARVLEEVGLKDRKRVRVKSLSGGQRKRVSIGLELLARPPLLFLDEPTSGLDPALEEQMMELFRSLTGRERVTVVTTHVLASLALVDLAVVVAGGRVVYVGPPKEAASFFDSADLPEMYRKLSSGAADDWAKKFESSSLYQTYVEQRLREPAPPWPTSLPATPVDDAKAVAKVDKAKAKKKKKPVESPEEQLRRMKESLKSK